MSKRGVHTFVDPELYNELLQIVRENDIEGPDTFLKSFILFIIEGSVGYEENENKIVDVFELLRWAINKYKNNDPGVVYLIEEGKTKIGK